MSPAPPTSLLLTRRLPSPPRSGRDLRSLSILEVLADRGPTFVFGLAAGGPPPPGVAGWQHATDPGAALSPTGDELTARLRAGRSPFATATVASAREELAELVAAVAPDLAIVCGLDVAPYVDVLRPRVPTVVLDLDFAQGSAVEEMARVDTNRRRAFLWRQAVSAVARDEGESVRTADQVWVAAGEDVELIGVEAEQRASVVVVPNVVDTDRYPSAERADPHALVYTSRFDYWPNEEAARILVHDILPLVPDASLALVGLAPPPWLRALDDPRVTVTGAVPDVRPYLAAAAVMPVPLTAGGGTRFKVLEAMATGVPVVSTTKGVEGLGLVAGCHYLQAEDPDAFARAVRLLADDPAVAQDLVDAARALVRRDFSIAALRDALSTALDRLAPAHGAG